MNKCTVDCEDTYALTLRCISSCSSGVFGKPAYCFMEKRDLYSTTEVGTKSPGQRIRNLLSEGSPTTRDLRTMFWEGF